MHFDVSSDRHLTGDRKRRRRSLVKKYPVCSTLIDWHITKDDRAASLHENFENLGTNKWFFFYLCAKGFFVLFKQAQSCLNLCQTDKFGSVEWMKEWIYCILYLKYIDLCLRLRTNILVSVIGKIKQKADQQVHMLCLCMGNSLA